MKNSKNELEYLYLTHPSGVSTGAYDQIEWSSRIQGAARSPQARIVTIHEMLHSDLNNSTGFGTILIVIADICRRNPERRDLRETLKKLVDRCRTVHEVFATTGSLLLLVDELDTKELLKFYPNYHRYHQIGLSLCSAFKGFTLRYNSLYTIVRACMQSTAINNVLKVGLHNFGLKDLKIRECPDNRLNTLRFGLTDKFWLCAIERARTDCPDQEFWIHIDKEEKGMESNVISSNPRFDLSVDHLIQSFYISCTEILKLKSIKSLSFNGHQSYTQPMLDSSKTFYSESQIFLSSLQGSQDEAMEELIVRNLECERLVLHEPYEGQIYRLDKIPKRQWSSLVAGDHGSEHYFICVRPAIKLKQQYRFNLVEEQFLNKCGNEPLLLVRRSVVAATEKRVVHFYYIDRPNILDLFFRECIVGNNIFSNVSLSVYLNNNWKIKWDDILQTNTKKTLLMDISPTAVLKSWAKMVGCHVGYELINFRINDDLRSVLAFDFQSGKWPLVLVPCSSITADGFVMYINSKHVPEDCFNHSENIVIQNQFLLSIMLGHLFREEAWFDFKGAITEGTGEDINP